MCGCSRCTSIARRLIDIVGYGIALTRDQLKLAAELVLRYAANYTVTHSLQQHSNRPLALAARLYVTAVPL